MIFIFNSIKRLEAELFNSNDLILPNLGNFLLMNAGGEM